MASFLGAAVPSGKPSRPQHLSAGCVRTFRSQGQQRIQRLGGGAHDMCATVVQGHA